MEMLQSVKYAVLAVVGGAGVFAAQGQGLSGIRIETVTLSEVISVLTAFLVIAFVVERCVEVALELIFARRSAALMETAVAARSELMERETAFERQMAMAGTPDERVALLTGGATQALSAAMESAAGKNAEVLRAMAREKGPRTLAAVSLSIALSLLVSLAGFRILSSLVCSFQVSGCGATEGTPTMVFADVVTTTFVIAGGADGMHLLIKRLIGAKRDISQLATG